MKITNPPCHIGIILDGNGRWAKKRHSPRLVGHKAGANAVKKMLIAANKIGIKVVSVYAFSTENWKRSKEEVNGIFDIIEKSLDENFDKFVKNNYKFLVMGDISKLNTNLQTKLEKLIDATKNNTGLVFNVALNYGGRAEIVRAANKLIESGKTNISEQDFEKELYTSSLPPLDFVIRTGGEQRISNFMLWQIAYAEFYFPKYFWPSFNERKLKQCCKEFAKRDRRFGNIK